MVLLSVSAPKNWAGVAARKPFKHVIVAIAKQAIVIKEHPLNLNHTPYLAIAEYGEAPMQPS